MSTSNQILLTINNFRNDNVYKYKNIKVNTTFKNYNILVSFFNYLNENRLILFNIKDNIISINKSSVIEEYLPINIDIKFENNNIVNKTIEISNIKTIIKYVLSYLRYNNYIFLENKSSEIDLLKKLLFHFGETNLFFEELNLLFVNNDKIYNILSEEQEFHNKVIMMFNYDYSKLIKTKGV